MAFVPGELVERVCVVAGCRVAAVGKGVRSAGVEVLRRHCEEFEAISGGGVFRERGAFTREGVTVAVPVSLRDRARMRGLC